MKDDETVILSYSRQEAISDRVLIDVSVTAGEAGFRYPVALTHAAHVTTIEMPTDISDQDELGRLWEVLTMLRLAISGTGRYACEISFDVLVRNDERGPKLLRLKAVCGPNDDLSPCITIMLPEED